MAANLLLAGYFGCGNLGDDAILLGFVQALGGEGYGITVLSGAPEETYRLYGFHSVPRRDLAAVGRAIEKCDCLVFPGGSIFQDVTSVKSAAYYAQLVRKAKSAGKRVLLLGQGVGPLNSFFGKRFASAAFQAADGVAVRDPGSLATLKSLGVTRAVRLAADPAFLLPKPQEAPESDSFQVGQMRTVGISVRPYGKGRDVANMFAELARLLFKANSMPVLIEMDRGEDGPLILEISKQQGGKVPDLRKLATPMHLQQRMARMDSIIAMRLHAGILAATVGIPPLMVSYDPKVSAFAKLLDVGAALAWDGLTATRLFEAHQAFQKDRERNERILLRKRDELAKLAEENLQLLRDTLSSPAKL